VVVDCCSDTDVVGQFGSILPSAEFVRIERNVGFGAAANLALEVSGAAPQADFFLFLHDDVELEPEAASLLLATALETSAGVVGGKGVEWDHPERLLEVGMSADQFGYPYSGLEPGEIDQGQHDKQREALFVTCACLMASRRLVETCGLWDGAYFAFGEDLDLCTRARLAGFKVMVQPGARYRHIEALSNARRPVKGMPSVRFLTRRNRLRTIVKNAAVYRMLALLALYGGLSIAEVILLGFFGKFDEIGEYPKAMGSFFVSIPDILRRRRAVQKRRTVPDRKIRALMVSDLARARVFFEARLRAWERGTLAFGARTLSSLAPSAIKATLKRWIRRPTTVATLILIGVLVFAMRAVLVGAPIAGGSLWPFPGNTGKLVSQYFSGWRDVGLGSTSAAPPAFVIFWLFSLLALGKAVLAQKLMLVVFVTLGLIGVHRFVAMQTRSPLAPVASMGVYALAPVLGSAVTSGDLGALALYAGLPFMLSLSFRIASLRADAGQTSGSETDALTKYMIRLALITVGVVAVGPSSLIAVSVMWILLAAGSILRSRASAGMRGVVAGWGWVLLSLPACLLILIPWSLEALRSRGAILGPLFSKGRDTYFPLWLKLSGRQMLLLDLHGAAGVLAPLAIVVAVLLLAGEQTRSLSRVLIGVWAVFALLGALAVKGYVPPLAASPGIWMIGPLLMAASLAGLAVGGIKQELPRHSFGWRHKVAIPVLLIGLSAGMLAGWAPSLLGWDRPADSFAAGVSERAASIGSLLASTAEQTGDFRVLWLGGAWLDQIRAGAAPVAAPGYFLTGPGGLSLLNAQSPAPSRGEKRLEETIQAMSAPRVHLAGHLLAPANIRFVIVNPKDAQLMSALRTQRDIALEQQQGDVAIFRNLQWLPRAALAPVTLAQSVTAGTGTERSVIEVKWSGGLGLKRRSDNKYSSQLPRTRHSQVLLAENFNKGWHAKVGSKSLKHTTAFGWANRFLLPAQGAGQVRIYFSGKWLRLAWLFGEFMILLVAIGAAGAGRGEIAGRLS